MAGTTKREVIGPDLAALADVMNWDDTQIARQVKRIAGELDFSTERFVAGVPVKAEEFFGDLFLRLTDRGDLKLLGMMPAEHAERMVAGYVATVQEAGHALAAGHSKEVGKRATMLQYLANMPATVYHEWEGAPSRLAIAELPALGVLVHAARGLFRVANDSRLTLRQCDAPAPKRAWHGAADASCGRWFVTGLGPGPASGNCSPACRTRRARYRPRRKNRRE